jgi:outer membrane lipoprotein-sorting protein
MNILDKPAIISMLLLFALIIAAPSSFAGGDATISPASLLTLVRQNYNGEAPLETKLNLTIYWSVREKEEKKQGSLLLAPGDCFRVTVGSETYVSNGKTLWTYNSRANQVVVKPLADVDLSLHPSRLFETWLATCPFREKVREKGTALLVWKSDSASVPYTSVQAWVQIKTGTVTKCQMTDRNKNLFTYTFSGTVFGKKVPREAFDFVVPKDARVIDSRK